MGLRVRSDDAQDEQRHHFVLLITATAIAIAILLALENRNPPQRDLGGFPGVSITPEKRSKQLYIGVPRHGTTLGSDRAPLRMVEFLDLQCPLCAYYSQSVLPDIVNNYVRTRKVQLELRPLTFLGHDSVVAGRALGYAETQNRLWQFADFFYLNQGQENGGYVTSHFLTRIARLAKLDPAEVLASTRSRATPALITQAVKDARRYHVTGAPTFFLGRRGQPLRRMRIPHMNINEFAIRFNRQLAR